jgi:hypothetical protein
MRRAAGPFEEREGGGMRLRADQRRHSGHERGSSSGDRHLTKDVRAHDAGRGVASVVPHPDAGLLDHQAGAVLAVAFDELRVDAFSLQSGQDPVAGRIGSRAG